MREKEMNSGKKRTDVSPSNVSLILTTPQKPAADNIRDRAFKRMYFVQKYSNVAMGKILQPDVAGVPVKAELQKEKFSMGSKGTIRYKPEPSKRIIQSRNASVDIIAHHCEKPKVPN